MKLTNYIVVLEAIELSFLAVFMIHTMFLIRTMFIIVKIFLPAPDLEKNPSAFLIKNILKNLASFVP